MPDVSLLPSILRWQVRTFAIDILAYVVGATMSAPDLDTLAP